MTKKTTSSNRSRQKHDPSQSTDVENPIIYLREWFPYPISVLAGLADNGGGMSGSNNLRWICPNQKCATLESDLDFYVPRFAQAVYELVRIFNFQGVQWENTLSDRIKDLDEFGMTIIPFSWIQATARSISKVCPEEEFPRNKLHTYLTRVINPTSRLAEKFITDFCDVCQGCIEDPRLRPGGGSDGCRLIVFKPEARFQSAIPGEETILEGLHDLLHQIHTYGDGGPPRMVNELQANFSTKALGTLRNLEVFMRLWEEAGYHNDLLPKYLKFHCVRLVPYISRRTIDSLIVKLLRLDGFMHIDEFAITADHRYGFPMLRGTIQQTKIQLILLKPREGQVVRTVLDYYASHVMSFMSGTVGMHFYYETAKKGISEEFDFKHNPLQRQRLAELAIKKYQKLGWEFRKSNSEEPKERRAGDSLCRTVKFDKFYEQAFVEANVKLPGKRKWSRIMNRQRKELATYSWLEKDGRLLNIRDPNKILSDKERLVNLVHGELKHHPLVISDYNDVHSNGVKSTVSARFDVIFSGVGDLLEDLPVVSSGKRLIML